MSDKPKPTLTPLPETTAIDPIVLPDPPQIVEHNWRPASIASIPHPRKGDT